MRDYCLEPALPLPKQTLPCLRLLIAGEDTSSTDYIEELFNASPPSHQLQQL